MFKSEQARSNKGLPFGAIVLIALGAIFLLNNFGVLPWDIWQNIWKFWPILLVLFGLEILLGRSSSFRLVLILLLLIFLVPLILILNPLTRNPLANGEVTFEKPLGNLTKLQLNFKLPSNNLTIKPLETNSSQAFKAKIKYSKVLPEPLMVEEKHFGEASYTFSQPYRYVPFFSNLGNTSEVSATNLVPLEIYSTSTAGVYSLDLKALRVSLVGIESTTGQIDIKYAKDFSNKTYIKTTAANISLEIPAGIEARVSTDTPVKNFKIENKNFKGSDKTYQTTNYSNSSTKITIEVSGSASSITIK